MHPPPSQVLARSTFSWAAALLSPHLATLYSPDLEPARWPAPSPPPNLDAAGAAATTPSPLDFCLVECSLPGYASALRTAAAMERQVVRPVPRGAGDADESLFPVMLGYRRVPLVGSWMKIMKSWGNQDTVKFLWKVLVAD